MTWNLIDTANADAAALAGRTVAVIGYGNQGHAHALNLRDSGLRVIVGQKKGGRGFDRAIADGFDPVPIADAVRRADLVVVALPDELASGIYESQMADHLTRGNALGFIHGFNVRFSLIRPPDNVDCFMVAPKGPGSLLRSLYLDGKGLPALLAVERDVTGHARETAMAWAHGIGATRAGVVETTFAAETEVDLFGEQVVLCGGVSALAKAAFQTLVDAGYPAELAYLECVHELKQVVDLLYEAGLSAMREKISNTAEYGDLTRGPRLIAPSVRDEMKRILAEIRDGSFAREWIDECRAGGVTFNALFERDKDSPFELAGRSVRALMPWLGQK